MANPNEPDASACEGKIEVNLSRLTQLFKSSDPSPFHERELDWKIEEYIIDSAEEIPRQRPICLVIHLPADQLSASSAPDLNASIHNYFAYREENERRHLRSLLRDGRLALITGAAFLLCCILLRKIAYSFGNNAVSEIIAESMLIIGWVAMWRPLEIFLYEWVPARRRCQMLAKLAKMQVMVRPKERQTSSGLGR